MRASWLVNWPALANRTDRAIVDICDRRPAGSGRCYACDRDLWQRTNIDVTCINHPCLGPKPMSQIASTFKLRVLRPCYGRCDKAEECDNNCWHTSRTNTNTFHVLHLWHRFVTTYQHRFYPYQSSKFIFGVSENRRSPMSKICVWLRIHQLSAGHSHKCYINVANPTPKHGNVPELNSSKWVWVISVCGI